MEPMGKIESWIHREQEVVLRSSSAKSTYPELGS
jgi:hypothetical protein